MREKIEFAPDFGTKATQSIIKVIGVGGGGGNAVKHMYKEGIVGVDFLVCNTDKAALEINPVPSKLILGESGLGAGACPELACKLASQSKEQIKEFIGAETKMIFITAGMGKGTGTGATPVIAEIAREMGILTIGVVTKPFNFEGKITAEFAEMGIRELKKHVDSLIIVKNQNIIKFYTDIDVEEAFGYADDVLKNAVKCIAELITVNLDQNIDFNDIRAIMQNSGVAMLGLAEASGENRIDEVVEKALNCPLLADEHITNAKNFLFCISYGTEKKLKIMEFDMLTKKFETFKGSESRVIWGRTQDPSLGDKVKLSVIITNFPVEEKTNSPLIINRFDSNISEGTRQKEANIIGGIFDKRSEEDFRYSIPPENHTPSDFEDEISTFQNKKQETNVTQEFIQDDSSMFSREPEFAGIEKSPDLFSELQLVPQKIRSNNDPRFDDDPSFSHIVDIPAYLRARMENHVDYQEKTIQNSPKIEVEDDLHDFFKNIPD